MQTHPRYLGALMATVPDILRHRTCLYVGAHPHDGMSFVPELREAGYRLTIIEAHGPNVKIIGGMLRDSEEILHADLRTWQPAQKFDLALWWHGPEHLPMGDREACLEKIDACSTSWTIAAGPWGCYPQGAADGNPFQAHVSELEPEWFQERGWCAQTVGQRSVPGGQVVAWRKK